MGVEQLLTQVRVACAAARFDDAVYAAILIADLTEPDPDMEPEIDEDSDDDT